MAIENGSNPVEQEARALGWIPKEDFHGDPERWVDADSFVERGQAIMPMLKKNNEKLVGKVTSLESEVKTLREALGSSREAIEGLKTFQDEHTKQKVQEARKQLIDQLALARENDDVSAEVKINDQLADLRDAEIKAVTQEDQEEGDIAKPVDYSGTSWFKGWSSDNPWFGQDKRRTALAMGIAEELRVSEPELKERDFLDRVAEELDSMLVKRTLVDKVEGSRVSSSRQSSYTFADLPREAQEACKRQGGRLVGKDKAFATDTAWQKHYITKYFEDV